MTFAPSLLGAITQPARRIIHRDGLDPTLVFARAQTSSRATASDANGIWTEFNADVARRSGPDRRLLLEGQRTNLNTNPRAEGLVPGVPGTRPTGWGTLPTGVAVQMVGSATRNGISGVLVRFFGTPSSTGGQQWSIGGSVDVAAAGTTVCNSVFVALDAGSLANVANLDLRCASEGGVTVFTPSSTLTRIENTRTLAGTSSATTLRWNYANTTIPVDFTLFIGWPQREHAPFASSPILPSVGAPGASTRGTDITTVSGSSFATLFPNGVGTILGSVNIRTTSATFQSLWQVDDGSLNNRFQLRFDGTNNLVLLRQLAGAASLSASRSITLGTTFRVGMTWDATGSGVFNLNGGANATISGGPTGGLTTLGIGVNGSGAGEGLFGEIAHLRTFPFVIPATEFPTTVAAIPA